MTACDAVQFLALGLTRKLKPIKHCSHELEMEKTA